MATIPEGGLPLDATCRLLTGDGNGAGFLLTHDGLVATCAHAVYEGQTVRVQVFGDRLYTGHVVACRPSRDLALVKIEGVTGLPTVRLGDSKTLTAGERLFVVTYEQLPQSTMIATIFPDCERTARISRPLALEVGFAGTLFVGATADDSGFRCVLTTRTDQVRPGSSGAMVCTAEGAVVGVHVGAVNLGGYGQEISTVDLEALIAEFGHVQIPGLDATATRNEGPENEGTESETTTADEAARDRWQSLLYALKCLELVRRDGDRHPEDAARDLVKLGEDPTEDPEILIARMHAHFAAQDWALALECAQAAISRNGFSALGTLRRLAPWGGPAAISRFLAERIEAMSHLVRRNVLRATLLGILNDAGEFERAARWADASAEDAYNDPNSALLRLECSRAYDGLGRPEEADTWLHRTAWAHDVSHVDPKELARLASGSRDPATRQYGMRQGLKALASGGADASLLASLGKLCTAQDAPEAATLFGSLERAFAPTAKDPESTSRETRSNG